MFLFLQSMYNLFTAYNVMCNNNILSLLPIRAVPNMSFSVFGRIRIRIVLLTGQRKRTQVVNVQDKHYATRFSR